jgi:hypothetical protein
MKLRYYMSLLAVLLGMAGPAQAAPVARALVYIDPLEYEHEVMLWHFYYSYWFTQGEALQPVALETLAPLFAKVGMCEENFSADIVIWLRPRIFYNPHMTMFYGRVLAQVYSGSGKPIATLEATAQRSGWLDVVSHEQVRLTYQAVMQELVRQMQAHAQLQAAMDTTLPEAETPMPCGMVTILPAAQR